MGKKDYGFIFEVSWLSFIEEFLKNKGLTFKKSQRNKLTIIEFKDKRLVIGTRPNSPGIAVDLELMKMYFDVKKVFRLGSFGGYHKDIKVGDILICTDAIRGEGTSKCYVPDLGYPAACDFFLTRLISPILHSKDKNHIAGTLWTTDSRIVGQYDKDIITDLLKKNVLGVDMDSAGYFVVSKILGMQSVNLSVAVDLPLKDKVYKEFSYEDEKVSKSLKLCSNVFMEYVLDD